MALPTTTFTVDGKSYTTRLLPARDALVLMPKLIVLLGRDITGLFLASKDVDPGTLLENPEVLASIVATIAEKAVESDGLLVLHDLMRFTTFPLTLAGGNVVQASLFDNFDEHFAGDYIHLIKVAVEVGRASFTKPSPG